MIRWLIVLLVVCGFIGTAAVRAEDEGRFVEMEMGARAAMPETGITIWLPPGYDNGKRRYPVVYMHDAQNLFFLERSNFNKIWAADKSALRLIKAKLLSPFIIVGINQPGEARYAQYLPQALYAAASPELRAKFDAMAKRPIYSDAYLHFIVNELKPMIDERFRTKKGRDYTAIAGSSMGGLISCYAFTRYPKVFGRAGCVSTHWPMGDPIATEAHKSEIIKLWADEFVLGLGKAGKRRLWMDHGDQTLDAFYPSYQAEITKEVEKLGWRKDRDFAVRPYPGTPHDENAWAARMDDIFGWMLKGW
jgi:predicted alpha/beta superfamily hydrolase